MVPDLAWRKTVSQAVGILGCVFLTVPKTSSGWDSEQECHLIHPLTVSLKINSGLNFFLSEIKAKENKVSLRFFNQYVIVDACPVTVTHHIYLPVIYVVSPPLSLVYLPVSSLSVGVQCYHWAVIRCIGLLKSGKVRLHLLEGSTVAAWLRQPFFKFCCDSHTVCQKMFGRIFWRKFH